MSESLERIKTELEYIKAGVDDLKARLAIVEGETVHYGYDIKFFQEHIDKIDKKIKEIEGQLHDIIRWKNDIDAKSNQLSSFWDNIGGSFIARGFIVFLLMTIVGGVGEFFYNKPSPKQSKEIDQLRHKIVELHAKDGKHSGS